MTVVKLEIRCNTFEEHGGGIQKFKQRLRKTKQHLKYGRNLSLRKTIDNFKSTNKVTI